LRWETWDATSGWVAQAASPPFAVAEAALDPDAVAAATLQATALPFNDHSGQMVLYAERNLTRFDGVELTLRSNPVLVTLYEAGP